MLDNLKPDLEMKVIHRQAMQKKYHDEHAKTRELDSGDAVYFRDYSTHAPTKYKEGVVKRRTGPVSVEVEAPEGIFRRHMDQVLPRYSGQSETEDSQQSTVSAVTDSEMTETLSASIPANTTNEVQENTGTSNSPGMMTSEIPVASPVVAVRRNPPRAKKGIPAEKLTI